MSGLIRHIAGLSGVGYGINILEVQPLGAVEGVASSVVGVVALFPWGPETLTKITSRAELLETFYPAAFGTRDSSLWPALRAFLNKSFPAGLRIVRPAVTGAVAALLTSQDTASGDSVTLTAAHKGALGNAINVEWVANASDPTARDAVVTIGSTYSETHKAVATIVDSALVVTDPGADLYTFTKASGATLVPDVAAAAPLATGSDGTVVVGDVTTAIEAFQAASADADIVFVAECPEAFIDAVNAKLLAFTTGFDKGIGVPSTPAGQAWTDAETYVESYRDDRLFSSWPKVKTIDWFDSDNPTVTVDGNAFAAAAMANVAPERSPGGAGGNEYLKGIIGLEDETATMVAYDALNEAGVAPFMMSKPLGGAIIRRAVTTSLTPGKTKLFRRRMFDFIAGSVSDFAQFYVEKPLDLVLSSKSLGAETGNLVGGITAFLEGLKAGSRIVSYSVDPFGENTQTNIDSGRWIIAIAVKLYSMQEEIVFYMNVGEGVQIDEA